MQNKYKIIYKMVNDLNSFFTSLMSNTQASNKSSSGVRKGHSALQTWFEGLNLAKRGQVLPISASQEACTSCSKECLPRAILDLSFWILGRLESSWYFWKNSCHYFLLSDAIFQWYEGLNLNETAVRISPPRGVSAFTRVKLAVS